MFPKRLYVAATSQHVGKTTTTLGLVHALKQEMNVGYCKPLGQQYVTVEGQRVDKDALLFSTFCDFDLEPNIHSPVILGGSSITDYIENPTNYHLDNKVLLAAKVLEQRHDIVIYEGTGHPGVGSCVDLSNADVAKLLGAGVIMVVEGGIGNTLDRLHMCHAVFERRGVPVVGVIVNKTLKSKIEKVRHYVGKSLDRMGIPLLGVIPYEEELGLPLMETVAKELKAQVLFNEDKLDNRVRDVIGGSQMDLQNMVNFDNLLMVVSPSRIDDALQKLNEDSLFMETNSGKSPLSGIILCGRGELKSSTIAYIQDNRIPVLQTVMDTYESVIKVSRIEVKINLKTPWKVTKAIQLFREHVNLEPVLRS